MARSVGQMEAKVRYAMQTPDGAWRVEIVTRSRAEWCRIVHDDNILDWPSIAAVQRIPGEASISMANLAEA